MIAANLIANASAHLDDKTMEEQVARVRKAIREVSRKGRKESSDPKIATSSWSIIRT